MDSRIAKALVASLVLLFGAASEASAEPNYQDVLRLRTGEFVHTRQGACVRTRWLNDRDLCGPVLVVRERGAAELTREERTIYFLFDHSDLTPGAHEKLNSLAEILKSDGTVEYAKIAGYADRIGSIQYNDRLSQRRAQTVRNYLVSRGYLNSQVVETRWFGKRYPSVTCPDIQSRTKLIRCLQPDRRVEVEVQFYPENAPEPPL